MWLCVSNSKFRIQNSKLKFITFPISLITCYLSLLTFYILNYTYALKIILSDFDLSQFYRRMKMQKRFLSTDYTNKHEFLIIYSLWFVVMCFQCKIQNSKCKIKIHNLSHFTYYLLHSTLFILHYPLSIVHFPFYSLFHSFEPPKERNKKSFQRIKKAVNDIFSVVAQLAKLREVNKLAACSTILTSYLLLLTFYLSLLTFYILNYTYALKIILSDFDLS